MNPHPTILVVDDDEAHLYVVRRAIERMGLQAEVCSARDGGEALRLLGLQPGEIGALPDASVALVMLDLRMPGMTGWDVLQRMREAEATRRIPVVILSSSDRPDDVRRSYELGANSYVVKRYEPDEPGRYAAAAARYWVELNQPARGSDGGTSGRTHGGGTGAGGLVSARM